MKWLGSFCLFCVIVSGFARAMQPNIIIINDEEPAYSSDRDLRFCCPYCFDKFILKQLFHDHLLTHPEVVAHGPIPGHVPYLGIYSTKEELDQKLAALRVAFVAAGLLPR